MKRREAERYRAHLNKVIAMLDDETALSVADLYLPWESGKYYKAEDVRRYGNNLYRCVQAHTSQDDWTPDATPALWTEISIDEWPEWKQPQGAHNAYRIGAKVSHNGKHWINGLDFNTYEPGVAGWTEAEG